MKEGDKVRVIANRSDHRGNVGEEYWFICYGTKLEHDHIVVIGDNGFLTNFSLFLSEIEKV